MPWHRPVAIALAVTAATAATATAHAGSPPPPEPPSSFTDAIAELADVAKDITDVANGDDP